MIGTVGRSRAARNVVDPVDEKVTTLAAEIVCETWRAAAEIASAAVASGTLRSCIRLC